MSDVTNGTQSAQNWNPILEATDAATATAALGQIEQLMPFLVGLTPLERKRLARVGVRTRPFIADTITTAEANPGIVPRSVDIAALRERADSLDRVTELRRSLQQLLEKVTDTEALIASRVYGVARSVYAVMKTPATVPGLTERKAILAKRFARNKKSQSNELPAAA